MQAAMRERPSRAIAGTAAPWRLPSTALIWLTLRSAALASPRGTVLARRRRGALLHVWHAQDLMHCTCSLVDTDPLLLCVQLWCVLLLLRARPRPPLALAQLRTLQAAMQGMAQGGRALPQVLIQSLGAASPPVWHMPSSSAFVNYSTNSDMYAGQTGRGAAAELPGPAPQSVRCVRRAGPPSALLGMQGSPHLREGMPAQARQQAAVPRHAA
jgi:hypothetical protein